MMEKRAICTALPDEKVPVFGADLMRKSLNAILTETFLVKLHFK